MDTVQKGPSSDCLEFFFVFCVILLLKHTRKIKFTTLAIFQCRGGIKYIHNIVQCHVVIFINFLEVQLIYNVVLISAVQQNDLVTYMYTFFFIFFSIVVYCRIVNGVPFCHCLAVFLSQNCFAG